MRRMRFLALGIVSFVVAIVGTLLAPGTFINRAFSAALCTLFSFNWTVCTVDLGGNSQRVVAANPPAVVADISNYLQAQRDPSEFGDEPSAPSPQQSNPQAPPFPQDPGPNFPVRREFDDPDSSEPNQPQSRPEPSRLTPGRSGASINEPCNPTLVTASAKPATEVIVKGVPNRFTELEVAFKAIGTDKVVYTAARRLEQDTVAVVVPLHPTGLTAGGEVQLILSSGNVTCSAMNFRIDQLPKAPGTTQQVLTKLETTFNKLSQKVGANSTQLRDDLKSISPELQSLAMAQLFLDHPDNPNSLKAILEGKAPILEGQTIDFQLLDDLLASSGFINNLNVYLDQLAASDSLLFTGGTKAIENLKNSRNNFSSLVKPSTGILARLVNSEKKECRQIDTAAELDIAMTQQAINTNLVDDPKWQLLKGSISSLFLVFGIAASIVTLNPAVGFAVTKAFPAIVNSVLYALEIPIERQKALLPSKLTSLTFKAEPISFEESPAGSGRYTPGSGKYSQVYLSAEGEEWNLTYMKLVQITLDVFGSFLPSPVLPTRIQVRNPITGEVTEVIARSVQNRQIAGAGGLNILQEAIKAADKVFSALEKAALIKQGPCKYDKIDVADLTYTEPVASTQGIISLSPPSQSYQPVGSGETTLSIRLRNKPNLFGGKQPPNSLQTITVGKKDDDQQQAQRPTPQGNASSWGDPHLTTFDGQRYDHQAMGEFVLTRTKNRQFEIQVREAPYKAIKTAAINSAAAMKVGNTRVALYAAGFPDDQTNIALRIDGKPVDLQGTQNLPGGGSITRTGNLDWVVQWPTGEQASFHIRGEGGSTMVEITPAVPDSDRGQLEGLLGNFNGNTSDDFMTRDGRVIAENKEAMNVARSVLNNFNVSQYIPIQLDKATELFLESIHKQFGDSWRVSQSESLFDYAPGKNTDSFTNRSFPNGFVVLRMLAPQAVQLAEETCRKAEVPSDRLEGCLFDVGVTGDVSFANIAANIIKNQIRQRAEQEIRNRIPVRIPGLGF